jgi:hypothetical protein
MAEVGAIHPSAFAQGGERSRTVNRPYTKLTRDPEPEDPLAKNPLLGILWVRKRNNFLFSAIYGPSTALGRKVNLRDFNLLQNPMQAPLFGTGLA